MNRVSAVATTAAATATRRLRGAGLGPPPFSHPKSALSAGKPLPHASPTTNLYAIGEAFLSATFLSARNVTSGKTGTIIEATSRKHAGISADLTRTGDSAYERRASAMFRRTAV